MLRERAGTMTIEGMDGTLIAAGLLVALAVAAIVGRL